MSELPPFRKYIEIERLGHDENYGIMSDPDDVIVIEEKIDGGNAQFRWWDGDLLFGTRNNHFKIGVESAQSKQFGTNAQWVAERVFEYIKDSNGESFRSLRVSLHPDYIYYGEWCKKHTINYNWVTMPKFIGFDILNITTHIYLPYDAMKEEYDRLGLPTIPLITKAKVSELDIARLENFIGKSAYYDGTMEGIVIKNYFRKNVYGRQMFAKLVTQHFKEANMAAFGGGVKALQDDTTKFLDAYYTEARIRKAIHRLIDEGGQPLGRELMHHLPRTVIEDIMKEEVWSMVKEFETIQFNLIKKMAPKLCLRVVDKMMDERVAETQK